MVQTDSSEEGLYDTCAPTQPCHTPKMSWRKGKIPLPHWQLTQWLHFQAGAGQLVGPATNHAQVLPQPEWVRVCPCRAHQQKAEHWERVCSIKEKETQQTGYHRIIFMLYVCLHIATSTLFILWQVFLIILNTYLLYNTFYQEALPVILAKKGASL